MKKHLHRLTALLAAAILALSLVSALAEAPALPSPQGVAINYGADPASSADDTVSFEAVEGATSYKVYVYQEGASGAKVTQGTESPIAVAAPLSAGEYLVAVVALNDGGKSKASAPIAYVVEEEVKEKLGQVSDIAMDFSQVDANNAVYPIISFTPVENAGRYLVDIYAANKDGEKQLTSLGYTTRFTVPAAQAGGYMMDSTNYAALIPGYWVVAVTAYSNNANYANGDPVEAFIPWNNAEAIQPKAKAEEPENGGINAALENYEDYNVGVSLDVLVYADAECQELVKKEKITYTTSESFGNVTHNNSVGIQVKNPEEAREGDLVVGTEYYIVLSFDPEIYTGDYASEPVSITCGKAGDGKLSTGNGGSGGGPGGPGGGMSIEPTKNAITFTAEEGPALPITFMNNSATLTPAAADAADGAELSYTLSGVGGMGEAVPGTIDLMADGTLKLHIDGFGPFGNCDATGSWSVDGDAYTITID